MLTSVPWPQISVLPAEELLRREQPSRSGGHLQRHQKLVLVHYPTSLELDPKHRAHFEANLRNGVSYEYFVSASTQGLTQASKLLQGFALSKTLSSSHELSEEENVARNLKLLTSRIRILPVTHTLPFSFRIHNPSDLSHVACYLDTAKPNKGNFIQLGDAASASSLANNLTMQKIPQGDTPRIFQSTFSYDVSDSRNRASLENILRATEHVSKNVVDEIVYYSLGQ